MTLEFYNNDKVENVHIFCKYMNGYSLFRFEKYTKDNSEEMKEIQ